MIDRQPANNSMTPATRTVRLRRLFTTPPERVYRAFLDPAAMARVVEPEIPNGA